MTLSVAVATKNSMLAALATLCNSGTIVLYAGTPPATADTALASDTVIDTLSFQATAFPAPSAGSMTANVIAQVNAVASGLVSFYRAFTSGAATIEQGVVGQSASGGTSSFSGSSMTVVTPPTAGGYIIGSTQVVTATGVPAGTTIVSLTSGVANTAGAVYLLSGAVTTESTEAVSAGWGDLQMLSTTVTAGGPINVSSFVKSM